IKLDTPVSAMGITGAGDVLGLDGSGIYKGCLYLHYLTTGAYQLLSSNVTAFGVPNSVEQMVLKGDGTLSQYQLATGTWKLIDTPVSAMGITGNGDVLGLDGSGIYKGCLYVHYLATGAYQLLSSNVTAF